MRSITLEETDHPVRAGASHEIVFTGERVTPSGVEANARLDGVVVGVMRGIDRPTSTGGSRRVWEVQLTTGHVFHAPTRVLVWHRALSAALALVERG